MTTPYPPLLRAANPGRGFAVPQVPPSVTRAAASGVAAAGAAAAPAPASSAEQKAAAMLPDSSRHHGFRVRIVMLPLLSPSGRGIGQADVRAVDPAALARAC
jgi:hypothetical protein